MSEDEDIASAAKVIVDPDLMNTAIHCAADSEDGESYSAIAATAFARWSGGLAATAEDRSLVAALALRLEAIGWIIKTDEAPRLGEIHGEAGRLSVAAAFAAADMIELDGRPGFRIEDVVARRPPSQTP